MKLLYGQPLLYWTIRAAVDSGVFNAIVVSSEDDRTLDYVHGLGIPSVLAYHRPEEFAQDDSADILWVRDTLKKLRIQQLIPDYCAILRPTSPFRKAETIKAAMQTLVASGVESIRAVRRVTEHPGKMWMVQRAGRMVPLLPFWSRTGRDEADAPWHSCPTQTLPAVYVQTAALEASRVNAILCSDTISATDIMPFFTSEDESLDLNTPADWARAEALAPSLLAGIPVPTPAQS